LLLANDRATALAVDGFAASCRPLETRTREQKTDPDGGVTVTERVTRHERDGDPAFVLAFIKAQAERRVLLGLTPPHKTEVAGPNGGPIRVADVMSPADQLQHYEAVFAALVAPPNGQLNGHDER
jgi:hypothetical protein